MLSIYPLHTFYMPSVYLKANNPFLNEMMAPPLPMKG
jgi:hypothetical protein